MDEVLLRNIKEILEELKESNEGFTATEVRGNSQNALSKLSLVEYRKYTFEIEDKNASLIIGMHRNGRLGVYFFNSDISEERELEVHDKIYNVLRALLQGFIGMLKFKEEPTTEQVSENKPKEGKMNKAETLKLLHNALSNSEDVLNSIKVVIEKSKYINKDDKAILSNTSFMQENVLEELREFIKNK